MKGSAGFTLLELLIALAIFGILMTGLTEGVHYGFQVWDRQAALVARADRLDAVDRTLRQLIGQIDDREETERPMFVGTPLRFDFTTELPQALSLVSRRTDASLGVEGHRLMLRWTPHLHATRLGRGPAVTDTLLLDGVERVEFRYWRPPGRDGTPGGWQTSWKDRAPPELVKIHIVFPPGDVRHWPDIIAARLKESDRD